MKFIDKIRSQPDHIRELSAGLCTVVVVLLVAAVWFTSFKHNVYALLNPDQQAQPQSEFFASNVTSLFGSIGETIKNTTAAISEVFDSLKSGNQSVNIEINQKTSYTDQVHTLPVSGNK